MGRPDLVAGGRRVPVDETGLTAVGGGGVSPGLCRLRTSVRASGGRARRGRRPGPAVAAHPRTSLADTVGLAFALAASTFCPRRSCSASGGGGSRLWARARRRARGGGALSTHRRAGGALLGAAGCLARSQVRRGRTRCLAHACSVPASACWCSPGCSAPEAWSRGARPPWTRWLLSRLPLDLLKLRRRAVRRPQHVCRAGWRTRRARAADRPRPGCSFCAAAAARSSGSASGRRAAAALPEVPCPRSPPAARLQVPPRRCRPVTS